VCSGNGYLANRCKTSLTMLTRNCGFFTLTCDAACNTIT